MLTIFYLLECQAVNEIKVVACQPGQLYPYQNVYINTK